MEERHKEYLGMHSERYRDTANQFNRFCTAIVQDLNRVGDATISAVIRDDALRLRIFGHEWIVQLHFAGSISIIRATELVHRENAPTEHIGRGEIRINHFGQIVIDDSGRGMDYIYVENDAVKVLLFKLLDFEKHFRA